MSANNAPIQISVAAVALWVLAAVQYVPAGVVTWSDAGVNWSAGPDWVGLSVPGGGDAALFMRATYNNPPSIPGAAIVGGVWDTGSGSLTINGTSGLNLNATTINNNPGVGIEMDPGAGDLTFNCRLILGSTQSWLSNSGGLLTVSGISNNGNSLVIAGTGNVTVKGVIAGMGALVQNNAGVVTLVASNTYTGGTAVDAGLLLGTSNSAFGRGPVTLSGGTLGLGNALTITNSIVSESGSSGALFVSGASLLAGNISGPGGLTVTGSGVLSLSGSNTYGGPTIVASGTLRLAAASRRPLPAGTKVMPVGDSITYGSGGSNAGYRGPLYNNLIAAGSAFQFVGTTHGNPGSLPTTPVDQTGHDGWGGWTTGDVLGTYKDSFNDGNSGNIGTWLTQLSGSGSAPNEITMMIGTNDYLSGGWSVGQGTANLSAIIDTIFAKDHGVRLFLGSVTPRTDDSVANAWANSYNAAIPALVAQKNAAGDNITLVDMNTYYPTSAGLSSDGLHPNDTGYAWLAGQWANAMLRPARPSTAIPSTSPLTVAAGAVFDLSGNTATVGPLSGNGTIALGGGSLTVNCTSGVSTFAGTISGMGSFTKSGPGTLVLAGNDSYTGGTYVNAGTLIVSDSVALPAGTSLTVGTGGVFASHLPASPVPEPSTTALLIVAVLLGGVAQRTCKLTTGRLLN